MEKFSDKIRAARLLAAKKRLQNYTVKGRWSKDETYQEGDVVVMADGLYKAVCESKGNQSDFVSLDTLIPQDGRDGIDAEQVELSVINGEVSWRRGDGEWNSLISTDKLVGVAGQDGKDGAKGIDGVNGKDGRDGKDGEPGKDGADGKEVELRTTKTHIQWRLEGTGWKNLVALASLKGSKGDKGDQGDKGESAYEIWLRNGNRGSESDFLASLRNRQTIIRGGGGGGGGSATGLESIVAGTDITVDSTDPKNPIISVDTSQFVLVTGDQNIAGVKTFASSPIVPTPTTDFQASTKKYVDDNTGSQTTVDLKENILAFTPTSPQTAFATDTGEFFVYDGTNWKVASIALSTETADPDIGYTQDNDKQGYGEDYIDGKKATDFAIGDFTGTPYNGAIKLDQTNNPMTFEIFARGIWNKIFYDFQMINGDLEHIPETFTIDVRSGNSNELGLNDVPIVQEYSVDIGAYPYPTVIDGGTL